MCVQIADMFEVADPLGELENLPALVWFCKDEHAAFAEQITRAEAVREELVGLVDQWSTEAATLVARGEDRIYGQACRDHAADLAQCLGLDRHT